MNCVRLLSSGKEETLPASCHAFDNQGLCVYCAAPAPQETPAPQEWRVIPFQSISGVVTLWQIVDAQGRMVTCEIKSKEIAELIVKCVNRDPAFQKLMLLQLSNWKEQSSMAEHKASCPECGRTKGHSIGCVAHNKAAMRHQQKTTKLANHHAPEFAQGVVYACARLVEMFDQPTMAAEILRESGVDNSEIRGCAEYDVAFLRKENPKLPRGSK